MVAKVNLLCKLFFTATFAILLTLFAMQNVYNKIPFIQAVNSEYSNKQVSPNSVEAVAVLPFNISYVENNLQTLDQLDPHLIQYTRTKYLNPPSKLPYNLKNPGKHSDSFSSWVVTFFKNKANGTFIEAGANDGESLSHTLHLEETLGWTGLLVECNPLVQPELKSRHRKAWVAEVCISPKPTPTMLNFSYPLTATSLSASFGRRTPNLGKWADLEVQTIPLYTILAALGWKEVDYLSFDIEGQELSVFKSFPFELFTFRVIIAEVLFYNLSAQTELKELLQSKGYVFVEYNDKDHIYVHKSVQNFLPVSA